ncbi:MAG: thiamine diphosphokinase [Bacteroidales bacterium]
MFRKQHDCLIVATGAFPESEKLLFLLKERIPVIACDGAVNKLMNALIEPDYIVGDLDSVDENLQKQLSKKVHFNPDQETNDLTKAAEFAYEKGFRAPLIMGATGLREDHTLGNISLLIKYRDMFDEVGMISDYGIFIPIRHTTTFPCKPGQQISVFALFPYGSITSKGLKYPITERKLPIWWEGTLNETINDQFTLEIEGEGNVLVYLRHPFSDK